MTQQKYPIILLLKKTLHKPFIFRMRSLFVMQITELEGRKNTVKILSLPQNAHRMSQVWLNWDAEIQSQI